MEISKDTKSFVNNLLSLPATGNEQDWELEFANRLRLNEFIEVLKTERLSAKQRYAIISLILASYDEYLDYQKDNNCKIWKKISSILELDKSIYRDVLNYWALWDEISVDNKFNITHLVRSFLTSKF